MISYFQLTAMIKIPVKRGYLWRRRGRLWWRWIWRRGRRWRCTLYFTDRYFIYLFLFILFKFKIF